MRIERLMEYLNKPAINISDKIRRYSENREKLNEDAKIHFFEGIHDDKVALFLMDAFEKSNEILRRRYEKCFDEYLHATEKNWICIILLLHNIPKEKLREYIVKIFHKSNTVSEYGQDIVRMYPKQISEAYHDILSVNNKFIWEERYLEIFTLVLEERPTENLFKHLEKQMRDILFENDVTDTTYFNALLEKRYYDAAYFFLERVAGEGKCRCWFGWDIEEVKQHLLGIPSCRIAKIVKDYIVCKNGNYSNEEWYNDIVAMTPDESFLRRWARLSVETHRLKERVVGEGISEEEFYSLGLECRGDLLYDLVEEHYCTDILVELTGILNYAIERNWDMDKLLKSITAINLFVYECNDRLYSYSGYTDVIRMCSVSKTKTYLQECKGNKVEIYLNSHIRFIVDFYSFVSILNEEELNELKKYTFLGVIDRHDKEARSARDRIYLSPLGMRVDYTHRSEKRKKDMGGVGASEYYKVIRNDEKWYSTNSDAKLLKEGEHCRFQVESFKEHMIFVSNIKGLRVSAEAVEQKREEYVVFIEQWLKRIRDRREFVKARRNDVIYAVDILSVGKKERERIAVAIVQTIAELLADNQQLEQFVECITGKAPYNGCNEFRTKRMEESYKSFEIKNQALRQEVIKCGNVIFNAKISDELKMTIYKETCLKRHYLLEKVMDKCFNAVLWGAPNGIILPVQYNEEPEENGRYVISYKGSLFFSKYRVMLKEKEEENRNKITFCRIVSKDDSKGTIYVTAIDLTREKAFREIIRKIYDTRGEKIPKDKCVKFFKRHENFTMDLDQVIKFTRVLNETFYRNDLEKCHMVLETIGEVNPFRKECLDKAAFKEYMEGEYRQEYIDCYDSVMERYKKEEEELGYRLICDLYFRSFMQFVKPYEAFLEEIADEGNRERVNNYCRSKYEKEMTQ